MVPSPIGPIAVVELLEAATIAAVGVALTAL